MQATMQVVDYAGRKGLDRYLPLLAPLAICVIAIVLVMDAGALPDADYWDMFSSLLRPEGVHVTLHALYQKSNEHIVAVTKAVYLLNYWITGGDNRGLSVVTCLYSLGVASILTWMLAREASNRFVAILLALAATMAAFSPMAAHNFFVGMSGVAWIGANLCAVGSIYLFYLGKRELSGWPLAFSLGVALLGSQTYSTGVVILCAVGFQGLLERRTRRLGVVFVVLGMLLLATVYLLQQTIPGNYAAKTYDPRQLAVFVTAFIGAGLTTSPSWAMVLGVLGLLGYIAAVLQTIRMDREVNNAAAFWAAIACYAVLNGGMAAVSRAGMGGEAAAMTSRYALLPALFWISQLGLFLSLYAPVLLGRVRLKSKLSAVLAVVLAILPVTNGASRLLESQARAEGKELAALSVFVGVKDDELIARHITHVQPQLFASVDALRAAHHVPFDEEFERCPKVGSALEYGKVTSGSQFGRILGARELPSGDGYQIWGWVSKGLQSSPAISGRHDGESRCMAIVDERGAVTGLALDGFAGAEETKQAAVSGRVPWMGYVPYPAGSSHRLVVLVPDANAWVPLRGKVQLNPN